MQQPGFLERIKDYMVEFWILFTLYTLPKSALNLNLCIFRILKAF